MPRVIKLKPLRSDLKKFLENRQLLKKWLKAEFLFENNIRHSSLNIELLQPKWRGIYSFRIDKKYRALFFVDKNLAEVFQITKHYK